MILASTSRDRLVLIFDATHVDGVYPFDLLQTLSEHTSTLTSMIFADSGSKLVTCGSDKAIIFRSLNDEEALNYEVFRNSACKSSVYNMALAQEVRQVIASSQDRRITLLDLDSGKVVKSFSTSLQPLDSSSKANPFLSTLATDPTGAILCAGASDKSIHLIDTQTEVSLYQGVGHGDLVTSVSFINNGTHVASTGADGCVFIWRVPDEVTKKMGYILHTSLPSDNSDPIYADKSSPGSFFKFEDKDLPGWARTGNSVSVSNSANDIPIIMGRWAERAEGAVRLPELSYDKAAEEIFPKVAGMGKHKITPFSDIESDSEDVVTTDVVPILITGNPVISSYVSSVSSSPIKAGTATTGTSPMKSVAEYSDDISIQLYNPPQSNGLVKVGPIKGVVIESGTGLEISEGEIAQFRRLALRISHAATQSGCSKSAKVIEELLPILSSSPTHFILEKYSSELVDLIRKKLDTNIL